MPSPLHWHTAHAGFALPQSDTILNAFEVLRSDPYPWLLESSLTTESVGRYSFAGSDPYLVLRVIGDDLEWEVRREVGIDFGSLLGHEAPSGRILLVGDPLPWVRTLLPRLSGAAQSSLPFLGGAVGYFAYELGGRFEPAFKQGTPKPGLDLPPLYLLFIDRLLICDHRERTLHVSALGFDHDPETARARAEAAAADLVKRVQAPLTAPGVEPGVQSQTDPAAEGRGRISAQAPSRSALTLVGERTYSESIHKILCAIEAGEAYQACLTHRMAQPTLLDPWEAYRRLRHSNPAPFAGYLALPEVSIVSSSPERFLRVGEDGQVESRPIKGTRQRGSSPAEDRILRRELQDSEKDGAENLMIADLVRNDLGRVSELGSVRVPELRAIEEYATVFQMVSTVCGTLRTDCDALDALRAAFPPGSMTGAPKIAAVRLLEELEPVRRGIYSGALGYLDCRGGADFCVVIRTLLFRQGVAYLHVGGGIVVDSDPRAEYAESLLKAQALLDALREGECLDPTSS